MSPAGLEPTTYGLKGRPGFIENREDSSAFPLTCAILADFGTIANTSTGLHN
jgi:hypothetical protein